jgi:hypothetical protein
MTETLILLDVRDPQRMSASLTAAAEKLKTEALEKSGVVGAVRNAEENRTAVDAQADIARTLKLCEAARKAAKAPVIELGRIIDDRVGQFVKDIEAERDRIGQLTADWAQLEQARVRAAEQARLAEERRIAEKKRLDELEVLRKQAEEQAKIDAQKAELARLAEKASKEQAAVLERQRIELERQQEMAAAASHDELDRIQAEADAKTRAVQDAPKPEAARAAGQRIVEDWEIVVSDIHLLYRVHPACVKLEALPGQIKSLLNAGVDVKGVQARKVTKATVRTSTRPALSV